MVRNTPPSSDKVEQPTIIYSEPQAQPGNLKTYVVTLRGSTHFKIIAVKAEDYQGLLERLTEEGQIPHYYSLEHYVDIDTESSFQPITVLERK